MGDTVIKSFLVGLGFGIDDASLKKFNDALKSATIKVTALYGSIQLMAAGIFKSMSSVSAEFEQMGYEFRLIAPAINKALVLRNELLKAYSTAGVNIQKVIQQSVRFNMALAKTQFAFKAIYASVATKFLPLLTKQMDIFRQKIYGNMPKIQASLEKFVSFIFKAFEATVILGTRIWSILQRVYDFFYKLHDATQGWSTFVLAAIAAWKLLNLSFLATPFGMVLAGIAALLALWDDFKTFKEGGQSLINWGSDTTKTMVGLAASIAAVAVAVYAVRAAMVAYSVIMGVIVPLLNAARMAMVAFSLVAALNPFGVMLIAGAALVALLTALVFKWDAVKSAVGGFFSGIGGSVMDLVGGAGGPQTQPLGANSVANNNHNQNVSQQTQITVMGSADAASVGKQVAGEQNRVNFDMVRNMKGATR